VPGIVDLLQRSSSFRRVLGLRSLQSGLFLRRPGGAFYVIRSERPTHLTCQAILYRQGCRHPCVGSSS